MHAAVLTGHGGPEMLEVRDDVPVPRPGPGEVLVEVAAAAVNNTDIWTREGAYGTPEDPDEVVGWRGVPLDFPRIQGADIVGVVVALGTGVDRALSGRRVLIDPTRYAADGDEPTLIAVLGSELDGGFAEYVVVAADQAHDVTDSPLSDLQLACLPVAYGTATGMLERAELSADETVLITGAAGGVGDAAVARFQALGDRVVAVDRDAAALGSIAERYGVETVTADVTVPEDVARAVGIAGRVDVMINNAAVIDRLGRVHEADLEEWNRLLAVNLTGPYLFCHEVITGMLERGGGIIVNVASVAGIVGLRNRAAYCASKSGVVGLTRALAADHAGDGLRVNAICPGTVETAWIDRIIAGAEDPVATRAAMAARQLDGRMGTPQEVAAGILFLASPEARFVNGSAFVMDGGLSAV